MNRNSNSYFFGKATFLDLQPKFSCNCNIARSSTPSGSILTGISIALSSPPSRLLSLSVAFPETVILAPLRVADTSGIVNNVEVPADDVAVPAGEGVCALILAKIQVMIGTDLTLCIVWCVLRMYYFLLIHGYIVLLISK